MPHAFRSTTTDDLPRIQELLQTAFGTSADWPYLDAKLLRWKHWEPGTTWNGSRGYVLEQDGKLLAHGSVWPVEIPGVCAAGLLDWAAVRFPPGMGVSLVRRLNEVAPVLVSTGGSDITRTILPRIGFRRAGNQNLYVRIVRPWKQFRTRPMGGIPRAMARLVRNSWWSIAPPVPLRRWAAMQVESLSDPAANHLLKCPAAEVTAWTLEYPDGPGGYFVLTRVGGQARIARLFIATADPHHWASAYAVACNVAMRHPGVCEIAALSSSGVANQALEANSFHFREQRPVSVYDPKRLVDPSAYPLDFDMVDDDMAYMNTPGYPYFA